MTLAENLGTFLRNPLGTLKLTRMMFQSAEQVFQKFFKDPEILAFFDMLTRTFSYVDADECPAILSVHHVRGQSRGGAYYPQALPRCSPTGSKALSERLRRADPLPAPVDEILLENGKAFGVRLATARRSGRSAWSRMPRLEPVRQTGEARAHQAEAYEVGPGFHSTHSNLILYIAADAEAMPEDAVPWRLSSRTCTRWRVTESRSFCPP